MRLVTMPKTDNSQCYDHFFDENINWENQSVVIRTTASAQAPADHLIQESPSNNSHTVGKQGVSYLLFFCFPRHVNRKLDSKQSTPNSYRYLHDFTHCATAPDPASFVITAEKKANDSKGLQIGDILSILHTLKKMDVQTYHQEKTATITLDNETSK